MRIQFKLKLTLNKSYWHYLIALMTVLVFLNTSSTHAANSSTQFLCYKNRLINSLKASKVENFRPTVGVEIEGSIPKKIGRSGLADEIFKILADRELSPQIIPGKDNSYTIKYTMDGNLNTYQLVKDGSIRGSGEPVELISPILRTDEDSTLFFEITEKLRKKGFISRPNSSGVHIHIGFENDFEEVLAFTALFSRIEKDIAATFHQSDHRVRYAKATTEAQKTKLLLKLFNGPDANDDMAKFRNKYHMLNLKSLRKHGTIEFRLFNSTIKADELMLIKNFTENLVIAFKQRSPELMELIEGGSLNDVSFNDIAHAINFDLKGSAPTLARIHKDMIAKWKLSRLEIQFDKLLFIVDENAGKFLFLWMLYFIVKPIIGL